MKLSNRYTNTYTDEFSRQRGSRGCSIVVVVTVNYIYYYYYFKIFYIIIFYDTMVITIGRVYMFRVPTVNKADRASVMG